MAKTKASKRPNKSTMRPRKKEAVEEMDEGPHTILLTLENNKRYAHTATNLYRLSMASLQPDDRRLPHCVCNSINEGRRQRSSGDERVVVIAEHDLNEYVLCVLEANKTNQCRLNLEIQPGEQIAFRTIGKTPVLLTGFASELTP